MERPSREHDAPKRHGPSQSSPNLNWGRFCISPPKIDPYGYIESLEVSLIGKLPREPYIKTSYQFILDLSLHP